LEKFEVDEIFSLLFFDEKILIYTCKISWKVFVNSNFQYTAKWGSQAQWAKSHRRKSSLLECIFDNMALYFECR